MACEKGKILFQNQNLFDGEPSIRKKLLYIGHAPAMYTALSAIENLTLALNLRYIKANASKILDRLNHFGLGMQANDPISIYSQGMLQRLKLAYAELTDWDLLLFDEPFTGLDQDGVALMDKALTQWIKEGKTMCMVIHNMERAKQYGDQILYLNHGVMESL
jgi:heme exporter protein A